MAQQQGQNVMRRYVARCLDVAAPVMASFTQHSENKEKRRRILIWKIPEGIVLASPCYGVTRSVHVKRLSVELRHAMF